MMSAADWGSRLAALIRSLCWLAFILSIGLTLAALAFSILTTQEEALWPLIFLAWGVAILVAGYVAIWILATVFPDKS